SLSESPTDRERYQPCLRFCISHRAAHGTRCFYFALLELATRSRNRQTATRSRRFSSAVEDSPDFSTGSWVGSPTRGRRTSVGVCLLRRVVTFRLPNRR